jgi:adenylosuccinate synthase
MPVNIIVGAQWGDEGKGRFVDWFARDANIIARYAGGDNAGHTVAIEGKVYKMHLLPSGILQPNAVAVMGNGMVINPVNLVQEIEQISAMGVAITPDNLVISARAHMITPAHIAQDRLNEKARGGEAIGTTLRGIGPAYNDKVARRGIRFGEALHRDALSAHLQLKLAQVNHALEQAEETPLNIDEQIQAYLTAMRFLQPFIQDTTVYLNEQLQQDATILCEGAQGTLLDVDHGSYPFVTSSSPSAGGALTGLGVGARYVERVIGVAKTFSTRVGGGPMPTELNDAVADHLRGTGENYWDEFGTTTGRPRRCGWLDGVMLKYAHAVNGFTELLLTKLDILSGLDEIKIATAYHIDGEEMAYPPVDVEELERAEPVYKTFAGWQEDIQHVRSFDQLPANAQTYIQFIAGYIGVPVTMVSVGPERDQVVELD